MALESGIWSTKSVAELLLERKNKAKEHNTNVQSYKDSIEDLKHFTKAENLEKILTDKSTNSDMNKIMEFHPVFFDEESGNNRESGVKELKRYLEEEVKAQTSLCEKTQKYLEDLTKELNARKEIEETKNTFIPIISFYSPILFRVFLTIFSLCIYFKLIDFNINYWIFDLPEVVIPTIITSVVLFVWEYYRFYNGIRKYYNIFKLIYMFCVFCKNKLYYYYKKIYSFYKKL